MFWMIEDKFDTNLIIYLWKELPQGEYWMPEHRFGTDLIIEKEFTSLKVNNTDQLYVWCWLNY